MTESPSNGETHEGRSIKLYAICLVKNEDDIITQTLSHAATFCEKIFVLDNGSTDSTWELVHTLSRVNPRIVPFAQTFEPYRRSLRSRVYHEVGPRLLEDDWWLILDSDEFLAEDPQPVIRQAVQDGAEVIRTWQVVFYLTDVDLRAWEEGRDSRDKPIFERRRYYQINSQEKRLFRNRRGLSWTNGNVPEGLKNICTRRIFNRHYVFRDPPQVEKRLITAEIASRTYVKKVGREWRTLVKDSRRLDFCREGEPWRFHLWPMTTYYRKKLRRQLRNRWHRVVTGICALMGSGAYPKH